MSKIPLFISYSHLDKHPAGRLNEYLTEYFYFKTFLAHDNLTLAENWPLEVHKHLINAEYVVALVSENFKLSGFANQEIGFAFALHKRIIPICIDNSDPIGFLYPNQGFKCSGISDDELLQAAGAIFGLPFGSKSFQRYQKTATHWLVESFCQSKSWKQTSVTINSLISISERITLPKQYLLLMKDAIVINPQIHGANWIMPKITEFMKNQGVPVDLVTS